LAGAADSRHKTRWRVPGGEGGFEREIRACHEFLFLFLLICGGQRKNWRLKMDILRFSADKIWEWLGRTPPELTALSVRCALILGLCIVFGQAVKAIAQAKDKKISTSQWRRIQ
jgi:hypothetical protein